MNPELATARLLANEEHDRRVNDCLDLHVMTKERDALREQVAEREDAEFKAGWNAGKACHTGIATLTEARAAWRASQKGTPT